MPRRTSTSLRRLLVVAGVLLLGSACHARFAAVDEPVPVERLVHNVGRYVQEHPEDGRGHYTLGRIHSLAFAQDTAEVPVMRRLRDKEPVDLPGFAPYQSIQVRRTAQGALSTSAGQHLQESLREYAEATRLMPKEPLYWMGKGWMLEQGAPFADKVSWPSNFPKTFKKPDAGDWRAFALEAYRKAYDLSREADLRKEGFGPAADTAIALEAGEGILRLLGPEPKEPALREEKARVQKTVEALNRKGRAVTPVIFSMKGDVPLEALLDPGATVNFDLGGMGRFERWPWVRRDTCILAWDPERSGRIVSGRQLFGSATWSMFWTDGYAPLAALDDDSNGFLTGRELDGLVIWQDRNGNGVSERDEVVPLSHFGICSIAVRRQPVGEHGPIEQGTLLLEDGTSIRTYDWVPTSRPAPTGRRHSLPGNR